MFCSEFMKSIRKWFNTIDKKLIEAAKVSVNVVERLKKILESDTALFITDIIPGNVDNITRLSLIALLRGLLKDLGHVNGQTSDPNVLLNNLVNNVKDMDDQERNAFFLKFSSTIASRYHGSTLKEKDYDLACQSCYTLGLA